MHNVNIHLNLLLSLLVCVDVCVYDVHVGDVGCVCVCVCVCVCMMCMYESTGVWHGTRVKNRGQLWGSHFYLSTLGSGDWTLEFPGFQGKYFTNWTMLLDLC
jgi:hypothetical protein